MSGKLVTAVLAVALSFLVASTTAHGQSDDRKNELTGIVGRTFISDQGITGPNAPQVNPFVRSGKGLTFEVNFSRYLIFHSVYAISGEVPAAFNLDEDLNSGSGLVPIDYKQIFVTPSIRVNLFPTTAVSPWVSLGGGFGHFSENSQLIYQAGPNPGKATTSGVLQAGLGLDVRFWHRFSIRGQVRDFWSGSPDLPLADTGKTRQHNYFVGGGLIWHF